MKTLTYKYKKNSLCRACKSNRLIQIFSLGNQPLANSFLRKSDLKKKEARYPLTLVFCKNCNLLQLSHTVNPDIMFRNYLYVSSTSNVFVKHFESFAYDVKKKLKLKKGDLVVDIGSNDGILLRPFKKHGLTVLGVDPAKNVAKLANSYGIQTICDYFNIVTSQKIIKKFGKAKVISAANVFAHTDNWDELVEAVKIALADNGVLIIEAPYLVDFLDKNLFDTIYHEHLSYISLLPLIPFFQKHNMRIFDAKRVGSHGGSIRIFVEKNTAKYKIKTSVNTLVKLELKNKLNNKLTYIKFAKRITDNKKKLLSVLNNLKVKKRNIVIFGAPAKGNTLLNYFGITNNVIDYVVDDNNLKQGLYTPGSHIIIKNPKELDKDDFEYILILAWNFADSIIYRLRHLKKKGVRFIIPVPAPKII